MKRGHQETGQRKGGWAKIQERKPVPTRETDLLKNIKTEHRSECSCWNDLSNVVVPGSTSADCSESWSMDLPTSSKPDAAKKAHSGIAVKLR